MTVKEAISKRFSNRYFIKGKEIKEEDVNTILDAGRLAPNGFGFEAWKFYYTTKQQEQIKNLSYGQKFIGDAGLVVMLSIPTKSFIEKNPDYIESKIIENGMPSDKTGEYLQILLNLNTEQYLREQAHIAASQMVLQAMELGIYSTIVGGFEGDKILDYLDVSTEDEHMVLVVAFGYSEVTDKSRIKKDLDTVAVNIDEK